MLTRDKWFIRLADISCQFVILSFFWKKTNSSSSVGLSTLFVLDKWYISLFLSFFPLSLISSASQPFFFFCVWTTKSCIGIDFCAGKIKRNIDPLVLVSCHLSTLETCFNCGPAFNRCQVRNPNGFISTTGSRSRFSCFYSSFDDWLHLPTSADASAKKFDRKSGSWSIGWNVPDCSVS